MDESILEHIGYGASNHLYYDLLESIPKFQRGEMLHQQAMNKDVTTPDLVQKDMVTGIIEEVDVVARNMPILPKDKAEV